MRYRRGFLQKLGRIFKKYWWVFFLVGVFFIFPHRRGGSSRPHRTKDIAELLHSKMLWFGSGYDDMVIALKNLNSSELKEVFYHFGSRPFANLLGFGQQWPEFLGGSKLDLFGWFSNELTDFEKEDMRRIWRTSGLSITF